MLLVVSWNNEPRLAHRWQQSASSAFQFHYIQSFLILYFLYAILLRSLILLLIVSSFSCYLIYLGATCVVTLCRWSAKRTILLSILARNQTKGLDSRSRRDRRWVRERERSWTKELTEGSWRKVTRVASWHRTAERPVGWDRVQQQWGKTSQDVLAFLVAYRIFARKAR